MDSFQKDLAEDLCKEVFAYFGRAYFFSECLHKQMCNMYVIGTFESNFGVTKPRVEEKMVDAYSLTLGQVFEKIKHLVPENFHEEVLQVIDKRNYLAHRFWFEEIHHMYSENGLLNLITMLDELSREFNRCDTILSELFKNKNEEFGITEASLVKCLERVKRGEDIPLFPPRRKIPKEITITKIYQIKSIDSKKSTIIFEDDKKIYWQFCDVGLGWSAWSEVGESWVLYEDIQRYLPCTINPRPKIEKEWNYEFVLGKGKRLFVKKVDNEYIWGLK